MKIRFVGARPREVAGRRPFTVQPGGEYEVPDRLGAALCEQKWFEPVTEPAKPKPSATSSKAKESTP